MSLRRYIRHAEVYGVAGVYETATGELTPESLSALAHGLHALDPTWTRPPAPPANFRNAEAACEACGKVVLASPTGRPRRYCSDACRQRAYRVRRSG